MHQEANKRLFFIVSLKRANVPVKDILDFYCCSITSVLEYCALVYHHALPAYLSEELEQKRVINILAPHLCYCEALTVFGLKTLKNRRSNTCFKFSTDVTNNPTLKLNCLLPPVNSPKYKLRHQREFCLPRFKTDRHRRPSFQQCV